MEEENKENTECSICDIFKCSCDFLFSDDNKKKEECLAKVDQFINDEIDDKQLDEYFLSLGKEKSLEAIKTCNFKVGKEKYGLTEEEIQELVELEEQNKNNELV